MFHHVSWLKPCISALFQCRGQRGPKRGFPTLRCDAPGGGWRCDAATLRRSGRRVALRRCDAATLPLGQWRCDAVGAATLWRCDAVGAATLRRCWRCDAATLRRGSDAATLLALRRCDAGATLRRCWRCDAATRERRCDAVGAATLPSARVHTALRRGATRKPPLKIVNECRSLYITGLKELNPYWRSSMNVEV